MKSLAVAGAGALLAVLGYTVAGFDVAEGAPHARPMGVHEPIARPATNISGAHEPIARPATDISNDELTAVVKATCLNCHSETRKQGNLSLAAFDLNTVASAAPDVAEKMIGKLRSGMMPPPGRRRPGGDTLDVLATSLERVMDARAKSDPNPGVRAFQRLNRAEYERSVYELLGLQVNAESWLPLDTRSANFDNIADAQTPSATVLDAYLDAASEISRLAVGDPTASTVSRAYRVPRLASQLEPLPGAPQGTRGGVAVMHTFPADGEYAFTITLHATPTGQLYGQTAPFDEKIEVSVDGARVALLDIDRGMSQADPNGMDVRTPAVPLRAGQHRVAVTFVRQFEGPVNDVISPIGHSIADTQIGLQHGITILPHLQSFVVTGPFNPTGVSDTPLRRRIFTCRPTSPNEARPCAEQIVKRLASAAYRRDVSKGDLQSLMEFYDDGAAEGGFEAGVRTALEAVLASPHFIFRMERVPAGSKAGAPSLVSSEDMATRLSFFLWGAPPDSALIALARRGVLTDSVVLERETRRMLRDPRAEALATRFAAQWMRLQDISKVHPDALQFPDFHEQLGDDMRRETELFFFGLVRDNRSMLELLTANYSFMNEALARHYGIQGVVGNEFRKVMYPDSTRTGVLGHASVLTLTSHANRTSPVLRGKWVMEVLMASPPPPPPPDIPDFEETKASEDGRFLTTRARMEMHRDNASCRSCHQFIDPIGLALDNFDVTGRWRIRENGEALDTRGDFYDGTKIASPAELQRALLKRPTPIVRAFTQNLMAYAIGRRVEYFDQPAIRRIEATAKARDYKMHEFIVGVVKSDPFRRRLAATVSQDTAAATSPSTRGR